jgi:hypothetical protein
MGYRNRGGLHCRANDKSLIAVNSPEALMTEVRSLKEYHCHKLKLQIRLDRQGLATQLRYLLSLLERRNGTSEISEDSGFHAGRI